MMAATTRAAGRARGRGTYPQVDPGAHALVNTAVIAASPRATVGEALRRSRVRDAAIVQLGPATWALREDLARADTLGLRGLRASAVTRPLPCVESHSSEVVVRRHLATGAPAVVVQTRHRTVGGVAAVSRRHGDETMLGRRFAERLPERTRALVDSVARCAGAAGVRAFLVGGVIRDALRATERADGRDLDIVVEGEGVGFARALAGILGVETGSLVTHERFLTASITTPGGARVDVATARAERYETPGVLPRVMPSTIDEDLARRDFTMNAMAVELMSGGFGLLDPFGGRADLEARRLRVLHPLSFVEDPTRLFRAARYAARLALTLDPWSVRCQNLALGLAPFPALSGSRLVAELELIASDERPGTALRRLGITGAFGLFDPRYRFARATAARLRDLENTLRWMSERRLRAAPVELALVALLADQRRLVATAALARLGLTGEPAVRVERALDVIGRVSVPPEPARASERARSFRGLTDLELAWLRLGGTPQVRAAVEWFVDTARGLAPVLRGDDVIPLGVVPGPDVARALAALRDARLDGLCGDRDAEVAYVRDWVKRAETKSSDPSEASKAPRRRTKKEA